MPSNREGQNAMRSLFQNRSAYQYVCRCDARSGRQIRVTPGRWPLITVDEARELALPMLRQCRSGEYIAIPNRAQLPTLRQVSSPSHITASALKTLFFA
jgi:hypothetical protein